MIELITGPMFSGKTTEMMRRIERYQIAGKNVCVVRPEIDNRENMTHSGTQYSVPILQSNSNMKDFKELVAPYDVVGMDELQFFPEGFVKVVDRLANEKIFICSAINGTSERKEWATVQRMIPLIDDIEFVHAVCNHCGDQYASRTYFVEGAKNQDVVVGGKDHYRALCRSCYELFQM